jgi:hypothetical protein
LLLAQLPLKRIDEPEQTAAVQPQAPLDRIGEKACERSANRADSQKAPGALSREPYRNRNLMEI